MSFQGVGSTAEMPRFDWYTATVRAESVGGANGGVLVDDLGHQMGAASDKQLGPRHGYSQCVSLLNREGESVGRIMHGGAQPWPAVTFSGASCDVGVPLLRERWGNHRVTRCDAAMDFEGPGAWEEIQDVVLGCADRRRVQVQHQGDWHRAEKGRTLMLGARSSATRMRAYEKGHEMVQKGFQGVSLDLVRTEVQVRPAGAARELLATAPAATAWGASAWSQELFQDLAGVEAERVVMKAWRPADVERATAAMFRQYRSTLQRVRESLGDEQFTAWFLRNTGEL